MTKNEFLEKAKNIEIGKAGYGGDIKSFPEAVSNALRRHPNVVLIGESRDLVDMYCSSNSSAQAHA